MGTEVYFILLIIGIITYFFWKWLFKRTMMAPNQRKIAIWASTVVGTPIIYLLLILLFFAAMRYYPDRDFDSVQWKNDVEGRYEYAEDLIASELLIGKSPKEVEQILGKSESGDDEIWVYSLNHSDWGNVDPDILEITFKNNKVVSVKQRGT